MVDLRAHEGGAAEIGEEGPGGEHRCRQRSPRTGARRAAPGIRGSAPPSPPSRGAAVSPRSRQVSQVHAPPRGRAAARSWRASRIPRRRTPRRAPAPALVPATCPWSHRRSSKRPGPPAPCRAPPHGSTPCRRPPPPAACETAGTPRPLGARMQPRVAIRKIPRLHSSTGRRPKRSAIGPMTTCRAALTPR